MFRITMESGATKRNFMDGYETKYAAIEECEYYNWRWIDEDGFEWRLDVEEYEEPVKPELKETMDLCIPKLEWAETFLEFREHDGDDSALLYLMDTMENSFNRDMRLRFAAIRRLVDSAYALNYVISMMENDEIPFDTEIEEAYRKLMQKLDSLARSASDIV